MGIPFRTRLKTYCLWFHTIVMMSPLEFRMVPVKDRARREAVLISNISWYLWGALNVARVNCVWEMQKMAVA